MHDRVDDAEELARVAVDLALGAGALIRDRVRARGGAGAALVDAKSTPTDLVTDVDRAAEAFLLEQLTALRPDDAVLGEEGGSTEGSSGVRWLLDPVDGTVNFVLGLPAYAVSVAAEVRGEVVAGAVFAPVSGELFHARRGGGAFLRACGAADDARTRDADPDAGPDVALRGPRGVPLARAVVGTGFGYDAARRTRQAQVVARMLGRVADIRRIGAASLDLCNVAAGRLDGYWEVGLNPWDWAAGLLVATEAGVLASGLRGRVPGAAMTAVGGDSLAGDLFALLTELDADDV